MRGRLIAAMTAFTCCVVLGLSSLKASDADDAVAEVMAGSTAILHGEPDEAIRRYTHALAIGGLSQPLVTGTHFNLADAYAKKGDYDKAIAEIDCGLRSNPDVANAYGWRGRANFLAGRYADAAEDFAHVLRVAAEHPRQYGAEPWIKAQALPWLHLSRIKAQQNDAEEFTGNVADVDLNEWPGPLLAFYLGNMTAEQLIKATAVGTEIRQRRQLCGALFHLGEGALMDHRLQEAELLLRKARDVCPVDDSEYYAAAIELTKMDQ
jgi:tetratricopeptide (TPR) repeat protein